MSDNDGKTVPYQWKNLRNQYLAALAANIIFLSHGAMNGWLSPALKTLISDDTPLKSGPLTNAELSWVGSVNAIAGIPGVAIFGALTVWFGCKRAMVYLTIPAALFWILVRFGETFYVLLIARFFQGITGGGIQVTIILYIAEIANDNIRGRLGSVSHLTRNTGVLLGFILGALLPYKTIPYIFIFFPITFGVWFLFLPNTPQEAESALKYYKGCKGDNIDENIAITAEFERLKAIANERKSDEKVTYKDFKRVATIIERLGIKTKFTCCC